MYCDRAMVEKVVGTESRLLQNTVTVITAFFRCVLVTKNIWVILKLVCDKIALIVNFIKS